MFLYVMVMPLLFMYSIFSPTLRNRFLFIVFILIANCLALLGFWIGARIIKLKNYNTINQFDVLKLVNCLFWIALIVSIPKYVLYSGDYSFNIVNRLFNLINGDVTFLDSYNARQNLVSVSGIWKIINYLIIIASPFHWIYLPLSVFFWKTLKFYKKIGTFFIFFLFVFQYVSSGASVGFIYFTIILASSWLMKDAIQSDELRFTNRIKKIDKRKKIHFLILIMLAFASILAFGAIMHDRGSGQEKTFILIGNEILFPNEKSIIWKIIPNAYKSTSINVYSYVLKAYAALDMALSIAGIVKTPLCFGAGGSWFLADNVKQLFGYDVIDQTYNMRIHEMFGYNYYTQWHTVYVWLANDFTFFGVPIVLFLLMIIWGLAWKDYLQSHNLFAFLLMVVFVEFVVFIPMNNQVFQHPETLFAFWGLLLTWLYTRKKYCFKL